MSDTRSLRMLLLRCDRCGRLEYTTDGTIDLMTQPDGSPCGGRFRASPASTVDPSAAEGEATMTNEELRQAAIECLFKVFKEDNSKVPAYVVQAAVSILVTPVLLNTEPSKA